MRNDKIKKKEKRRGILNETIERRGKDTKREEIKKEKIRIVQNVDSGSIGKEGNVFQIANDKKNKKEK